MVIDVRAPRTYRARYQDERRPLRRSRSDRERVMASIQLVRPCSGGRRHPSVSRPRHGPGDGPALRRRPGGAGGARRASARTVGRRGVSRPEGRKAFGPTGPGRSRDKLGGETA